MAPNGPIRIHLSVKLDGGAVELHVLVLTRPCPHSSGYSLKAHLFSLHLSPFNHSKLEVLDYQEHILTKGQSPLCKWTDLKTLTTVSHCSTET